MTAALVVDELDAYIELRADAHVLCIRARARFDAGDIAEAWKLLGYAAFSSECARAAIVRARRNARDHRADVAEGLVPA